MSNVRVRFAPAPTGYLHVGGARAALFNWLYARHTGGTFVLRIEDTDESRSRPELIEAILQPLRWLGLDWDEGPLFQSQRSERYHHAIEALLNRSAAYFCDCTRDQIDRRAAERGGKPGYDGHCRNRALTDGPDTVVRFAVPPTGSVVIDDIVRGRVEFRTGDLEDFVVRRSNGTPVFLVANAVDDAEMGITHAVRGEDLLNTTPKVLLLWRALELGPEPIYAHLPLLVGADRKKLSKRKDSVAMTDYIDQGYLPQAFANYLALLGWGPPDGVEIRPMDEIIELFSLEAVNKAPAFFDLKKLDHINGEYLRSLSTAEFIEAARPWVTDKATWPPERFDPEVFAAVADDVKERVRTLADIGDQVDWLFLSDPPVDDAAWAKVMMKDPAQVAQVLDGAIVALGDCAWDPATLEAEVRRVGDELGAKSQVPVRVAVTGRRVGPPLFGPLAQLPRHEALRRLRDARARLP